MPFRNPIAAGVKLIRTALQSPDYVAGVSGWSLNRAGDVEFNNGTFRGSLLAGGGNVQVTPFGVFMYGLFNIVVSTVDGFQMTSNADTSAVTLTANTGITDVGGRLILSAPEPPAGTVPGFPFFLSAYITALREYYSGGTEVRTHLTLTSPVVSGGTGGIATYPTVDMVSSGSSDTSDTSRVEITAGSFVYNGASAAPFGAPKAIASRYYDAMPDGSTKTAVTLGIGILYWIPITWGYSWTYDQVAMITDPTNVGSGPVTIGVYAVNTTTGMPDALLATLGATATLAGASVYISITLSGSFRAGRKYWVAVHSNSTSTVYGVGVTSAILNYGYGTNTATAPGIQMTQNRGYGLGLPSPASPTGYTFSSNAIPLVRFRAS